MPDRLGRSLSLWDCAELARELLRERVVDAISPQTVQRILQSHRLKPWSHHPWLGKTVPRDEVFVARTLDICDLYTRVLAPWEMVLSFDVKPSIQPRTRPMPTLPAQPGRPVQFEHEYKRKGALNLHAAFDTRTGKVYGRTYQRKRQVEFIKFLSYLDRTMPSSVTTIHIVCDNARSHTGRKTRAWLARNPRFLLHFTPKHCSWMNQVEQWFSILERKRLKAPNFDDLADLSKKLQLFIRQWNKVAKPFNWTRASFSKVLEKAEDEMAA